MARTVKPKSGVIRKVVSLKVTLRDTKPPVWRRLLAPGETTLGDLHGAIQAAMGGKTAISTASTSKAGSMAIHARSVMSPTKNASL
jgi:Plasmid pRiA4b ORF-3-like protein